MPVTNLNISLDSEIKRQSEELFAMLGLDMATAINIFLFQAIRLGKIPFDIDAGMPNQDTLDALAEAREIKRRPELYKGYTDVETMIKELLE